MPAWVLSRGLVDPDPTDLTDSPLADLAADIEHPRTGRKTGKERYANRDRALMCPNVLMRWELPSLTRVAWSALLIVLLLEAVPAQAFAQSPVCHPMRRGESATEAARRVTGNGQNAYRDWFQLMTPSSSLVPKSQYNRIRLGWRACVITPAMALNARHVEAPAAAGAYEAPDASRGPGVLAAPAAVARADAGEGPQPAVSGVVRRLGGVELGMLWLCVAMMVPWCGWRIADDYLTRRKAASLIVRYFAHRFVDEFERPLVRSNAGERAVRSDLRFGARSRTIRHSSRAGRGPALSQSVRPQAERRIRRGPGRARAGR